MPGDESNGPQERRQGIRLAGGAGLEAVVIDDNGQPLEVLREVEVLNISACGLCLMSTTRVNPCARIQTFIGDPAVADAEGRRVVLEVLECSHQPDRRFKIRCRLLEGRIPAQLIYNWFTNGEPKPA